MTVMLVFLCCGCAAKDTIDSETTETEPTVAGCYDNPVIDGNAEIAVSGTPYTDEEIMTALENDMEFLQGLYEPGCYLSSNGYYHVLLYDGEISYVTYDLPVVKERQVIGIITITRLSDNTLTYGVRDCGSELGELINEKKELAMLYSKFSEYAVSGDNEVFTIYGNDNPEILNAEKLYSTFNFGDNVATEKIFDDSAYYYQWK